MCCTKREGPCCGMPMDVMDVKILIEQDKYKVTSENCSCKPFVAYGNKALLLTYMATLRALLPRTAVSHVHRRRTHGVGMAIAIDGRRSNKVDR
jgi:hypothetical protein